MESFTGLAHFPLLHYLSMEDKMCCCLFCQQLIRETLRIHYGNEALIVNLLQIRCKISTPSIIIIINLTSH